MTVPGIRSRTGRALARGVYPALCPVGAGALVMVLEQAQHAGIGPVLLGDDVDGDTADIDTFVEEVRLSPAIAQDLCDCFPSAVFARGRSRRM